MADLHEIDSIFISKKSALRFNFKEKYLARIGISAIYDEDVFLKSEVPLR